MAGKWRTTKELRDDWKTFMRLLVRTAQDHPSRPYLQEAVRRLEDQYWRRVRIDRAAR